MADEEIELRIRTSTGKTFSTTVRPSATVREFKEQIAPLAEVSADDQRLIYRGRALKDELPLSHYNVEAQNTVHLVRNVRANSSAPPTTSAAPAQPADPLAGLGGLGGLGGFGGAGGAGDDPMMEMQRRLMADPEAAMSLLNSPLTQSILNNPDAMRSIVEANPRVRRVLEANPQLRHALSDPNLLREAMEVARSPARLREAMRHQDLALSQLENHPEGFNALRRMYEDVHEPLLDGIDEMATPPDAPQHRRPSGDAPSGALPNPWARPTPGASNGGAGLPGLPPGFPGGGLPRDLASPALDPAMLAQLLSRLDPAAGSRPFAQAPAAAPSVPFVLPPNPWAHLAGNVPIIVVDDDPVAEAPASGDVPAPAPPPPGEGASNNQAQLAKLQEMGFVDREANEQALILAGGDISAAINWLLSNR
ncbi:hypothetical protein CTAYLR_000267 [Chrysophaeum taylorii]|uniref:Ubiquilin n=1 Tax=Chrysophaeum taylorii TaxID=2483200 RepID=A0AAD7XL45_9STRA|nr:hypothetical protein CTAYLR_000267 [Chrysophaeum taylorii]